MWGGVVEFAEIRFERGNKKKKKMLKREKTETSN